MDIIAISIDGGLIQGIWANHPDLIGAKVVISNDSEAYVRIDEVVSGPDIRAIEI